MRNITFAILILAAITLFVVHFSEKQNIALVESGYQVLSNDYYLQKGETDTVAIPEKKEEVIKDTVQITVAPKTSYCVGVAPMDCLVVDGELFYDEISGFNYEPGFEYVLGVKKYIERIQFLQI